MADKLSKVNCDRKLHITSYRKQCAGLRTTLEVHRPITPARVSQQSKTHTRR